MKLFKSAINGGYATRIMDPLETRPQSAFLKDSLFQIALFIDSCRPSEITRNYKQHRGRKTATKISQPATSDGRQVGVAGEIAMANDGKEKDQAKCTGTGSQIKTAHGKDATVSVCVCVCVGKGRLVR